MQYLTVEGLPKPIIRGLEVIAETARKLAGKKASPPRGKCVTLGVRKGTVYGRLAPEEIYDDIPCAGNV
jgi:hypothetical protein